jgi:hypothetical protein
MRALVRLIAIRGAPTNVDPPADILGAEVHPA